MRAIPIWVLPSLKTLRFLPTDLKNWLGYQICHTNQQLQKDKKDVSCPTSRCNWKWIRKLQMTNLHSYVLPLSYRCTCKFISLSLIWVLPSLKILNFSLNELKNLLGYQICHTNQKLQNDKKCFYSFIKVQLEVGIEITNAQVELLCSSTKLQMRM